MRLRPNGTGSIDKTPTGRYRARFAFDGTKREAIDGSPFATYAEAEDALDAILRRLASAPVEGMTLARLGEKALARRDREGYRAIQSDRNMWSCYVDPWELASMPAKMITRGDVRDLLASLRHQKTKKPLATQTKRNVLNLLRGVFAYGCDAEIIATNPCTDLRVKGKPGTVETSTFLTLDEAEALIGAATDPAVALAIGTGLRSGELRSLCWSDVHLDGDEPHVVVRFGAPNEPTKNGKIRHVPLFGVALETLERMHAEPHGDVVLPSLSGWHRQKGRVVDPQEWRAWKTAAGITRAVRWHDLRHTCATLLLSGAWERAWSYEEVKEMLGHSSVKVTERYAHAVGTLASRAAKAMRAGLPLGSSPSNLEAELVRKASELLKRRGSDSNRRMTVLQTGHTREETRGGGPEVGSAWATAEAYARAVLRRDPHAHMRGLDLAEAVLDLAAMGEACSVKEATR